MVYVKGILSNGQVVNVPVKENGIYCLCPVCKQETSVEYDIFCSIIEEGDLEDSEVYCDACSDSYRNGNQKPNLTRIK